MPTATPGGIGSGPGVDRGPQGRGPTIGFLQLPGQDCEESAAHRHPVTGEPPWNVVERERLIRAKVAAGAAVGAGRSR